MFVSNSLTRIAEEEGGGQDDEGSPLGSRDRLHRFRFSIASKSSYKLVYIYLSLMEINVTFIAASMSHVVRTSQGYHSTPKEQAKAIIARLN